MCVKVQQLPMWPEMTEDQIYDAVMSNRNFSNFKAKYKKESGSLLPRWDKFAGASGVNSFNKIEHSSEERMVFEHALRRIKRSA